MSIAPLQEERRSNGEIRSLVNILAQLAVESNKSSWHCIRETYADLLHLFHQNHEVRVSAPLLRTFEKNRRTLETVYNPTSVTGTHKQGPLREYWNKIIQMRPKTNEKPVRKETDETVRANYAQFLRQNVISLIEDQRILVLLLVGLLSRRLHHRSTSDIRKTIQQFESDLKSHHARSDRAMSILIYSLCQTAMHTSLAADFAQGSLLCERAIELFRLLPDYPRLRKELHLQLQEALRVSTERVVNRLQEKVLDEEIEIIEDLASKLSNPELVAYVMPQLVFFLLRGQRYEECLSRMDGVLQTVTENKEFVDYISAITIGHYWCDALLKAERYSRGEVNFSFIEREKDNFARVLDVVKTARVPDLGDETLYNVEIEKLAVSLSHLGTLYFQTGNIPQASACYTLSFENILLKKCSRNRDSVDEIMDRYKDTLFHPLNTAPPEAHPLIAMLAAEKGFDFLRDTQVEKMKNEGKDAGEPIYYDDLINAQKELIADLMDATKNKIKHPFSAKFSSYKPFVESEFARIVGKMKINLEAI